MTKLVREAIEEQRAEAQHDYGPAEFQAFKEQYDLKIEAENDRARDENYIAEQCRRQEAQLGSIRTAGRALLLVVALTLSAKALVASEPYQESRRGTAACAGSFLTGPPDHRPQNRPTRLNHSPPHPNPTPKTPA